MKSRQGIVSNGVISRYIRSVDEKKCFSQELQESKCRKQKIFSDRYPPIESPNTVSGKYSSCCGATSQCRFVQLELMTCDRELKTCDIRETEEMACIIRGGFLFFCNRQAI